MATRQDKAFTAVRNNIAQFGLHIQWIVDAQPPFSYTVGMGGRSEPEFIIFNANGDLASLILHNLAGRVIDGVQRFAAGTLVDGLLNGFSLYLMQVDDSNEHLTVANRFYRMPGRPPLAALQVVQPGLNGVWPWEADCDIPQPLLGTQPADIGAVPHVALEPAPAERTL